MVLHTDLLILCVCALAGGSLAERPQHFASDLQVAGLLQSVQVGSGGSLSQRRAGVAVRGLPAAGEAGRAGEPSEAALGDGGAAGADAVAAAPGAATVPGAAATGAAAAPGDNDGTVIAAPGGRLGANGGVGSAAPGARLHVEVAADLLVAPCLCSFDVERTLTGRPSEDLDCPRNNVVGEVTLSELGQNIGATFCKRCYLAVVTSGSVGGKGSKERTEILKLLKASGGKLVSEEWVGPSKDQENRQNCEPSAVAYPSTLVLGCKAGTKQEALKGILEMLNSKHQAKIPLKHVYHFDDRPENIVSFHGSGINAQQVSCRHREEDGAVGVCGGTVRELQDASAGITRCMITGECASGGPAWQAKADANHTCGSQILAVKSEKHISTDEAMRYVATAFPEACGSCLPPSEESTQLELEGNVDGEGVEQLGSDEESENPEYNVFKGSLAEKGLGATHFKGPMAFDIEACQQWCTEERDCDCISFRHDPEECMLMTNCDSSKWRKDPGFTVLLKERDGDENMGDRRFKVYYNKNAHEPYGAVDLRLEPDSLSPESCQAWCARIEDCDCATYEVLKTTCWLKKKCDPAGWTSGNNDGFNTFMKIASSTAGARAEYAHCKTATETNGMEMCYRAALWHKNNGVKKNPDHYKPKGLTDVSPIEDFQNYLHREQDQEGCKVLACEPPPGPPYGQAVMISKASGSRDYNKVRVSLVRYVGEPRADTGDVKWSYKSQFKYTWRTFYIKSAIVEVVPGTATSLSLDGVKVSVKIPRQDEGSVGLVIADPCISSCKYSGVFAVKDAIQTVLHSLKLHNQMDYWVTVGNNFFDSIGNKHREVFGGMSLNASSVLFGATLGHYDYWIQGRPDKAQDGDSLGNGHVQWYAQDAISAQKDEGEPFELPEVEPINRSVVGVKNTFWYNSVGNVVLIGFSNAYGYDAQEAYFKEACGYAGKVNPALVLLLGHWGSPGYGCPPGADTPSVWRKIRDLPGCEGKLLKYVHGQQHVNAVSPDKNFVLGSFGYGHAKKGGQFGLPFFDTRDKHARLHYFKLAEDGKRLPSWDETMHCLLDKGIDGCTSLKSHELWMDEAIH